MQPRRNQRTIGWMMGWRFVALVGAFFVFGDDRVWAQSRGSASGAKSERVSPRATAPRMPSQASPGGVAPAQRAPNYSRPAPSRVQSARVQTTPRIKSAPRTSPPVGRPSMVPSTPSVRPSVVPTSPNRGSAVAPSSPMVRPTMPTRTITPPRAPSSTVSPITRPNGQQPSRFVDRAGESRPSRGFAAGPRPSKPPVGDGGRPGSGVAAWQNLNPGERTPAALEGSNTIGWLATPLTRTYPHRQELGYSGGQRIAPYRSYPVTRGYAQYARGDKWGYRDGYRPCYRPAYRRCYDSYPFHGVYYPWRYLGYAPWYGYTSPYTTTETVYVYGDYVTGTSGIATQPYPTTTVPQIPVEAPAYVEPAPAGTEERGEESFREPALVTEGREAFGEGRYGDARDALLRAILGDSRDGYAKLLYALAAMAEGDYEDAAAALRGAMSDAGDLITDPIDVRTFYRDPGEFDGHLARLREATQFAGPVLTPIDADDARLLLGYLYFASARPTAAREVFDELLMRDFNDELVQRLREAAIRVGK